jgi:hypothetical protein
VASSLGFIGVRAAGRMARAYRGELGWTAVNCNPNCNRALSGWEVLAAIRGRGAETLIGGILAHLAMSDRESPLGVA